MRVGVSLYLSAHASKLFDVKKYSFSEGYVKIVSPLQNFLQYLQCAQGHIYFRIELIEFTGVERSHFPTRIQFSILYFVILCN